MEPKVLIMGPPGAGKGTQSTRIAEEYGLEHITTGDALRSNKETDISHLDAEYDTPGEFMDAGDLVPDAVVELADTTGAALEVNLFNRSRERIETIAEHLHEHGADEVKGLTADARIPGLDHERAKVDTDGIYAADVVLVPLEDGDRAAALGEMGKTELVVDLNPLSRSAAVAAVPIVDNVVRALPNVTAHARDLRETGADLEAVVAGFDPAATRTAAEKRIRQGSLDG